MKLSVLKRTNEEVSFDIKRIESAIERAFVASQACYTPDIIERIALRVTSKINKDKITIEDIQDIVEKTLEETGYSEVARNYILYREKHSKLRDIKSTYLDFKNTIDNYLKQSDWRVKENATVTYSIGGLILHNSGAVTANYWLSEVYTKDIADAHKNGDMHIHDLSMLAPYCAGWSLRDLIKEGLGGIVGKITSAPAKHLSTLVNQMVNFLGILQNEWAGAQAFSSFDTYLAPFVKIDNLDYKAVKQCVQSFVFGVNTPSRWGTQSPFSNITLDWVVPSDMMNEKAIVGGVEQSFTYGDCQAELDLINKAFLEVMIEGDSNGRGFQYPIPTYNITKDFKWDTENAKMLFDITSKYGTPYFQNFISSDMKPEDVRSMCCRLQLDKRELKNRGGGLFGANEKTGSIGVVTINLPRIAYLSKNEEEFFERLNKLMILAKNSLESKRKVVTKLMEDGLFPYTKRYLGSFANHFNTIGLTGGNETCLNAKWINTNIIDEKGSSFIKKVLSFMRDKMGDFQVETGNLYNLEATPAESTSYRLAKMDKERYVDIITAGEKAPYYTNSTHLPVSFTSDIFNALDIQEDLQKLYTGGTVFHTFLGEKVSDWEVTRNLIKKIAENYHIPYYTISPTYSICKNHGYLNGETYTCPECGESTEVYSRITGYYRPVESWNDGKSAEFAERKEYKENSECKKTVMEKKTLNENEIKADDGLYLMTTKTCPKCPKAKDILTKKNINIKIIDCNENEFLAKAFEITSVPQLVSLKDSKIEYKKGFDDIIRDFRAVSI